MNLMLARCGVLLGSSQPSLWFGSYIYSRQARDLFKPVPVLSWYFTSKTVSQLSFLRNYWDTKIPANRVIDLSSQPFELLDPFRYRDMNEVCALIESCQ